MTLITDLFDTSYKLHGSQFEFLYIFAMLECWKSLSRVCKLGYLIERAFVTDRVRADVFTLWRQWKVHYASFLLHFLTCSWMLVVVFVFVATFEFKIAGIAFVRHITSVNILTQYVKILVYP